MSTQHAASRPLDLSRIVPIALAVGLAAGCVSDGADRTGFCLERASRELERSGSPTTTARCEPKVPAGTLVLAFPATAVSAEALAAAGATRAEIETINELKILEGPYARLNVVPPGPRPRPSRTTYHRKFVETPELLACRLGGAGITVHLRREGGRTLLTGLECGARE